MAADITKYGIDLAKVCTEWQVFGKQRDTFQLNTLGTVTGCVIHSRQGDWHASWQGFNGRFSTKEAAQRAVEDAAIAAGWRVPWRE